MKKRNIKAMILSFALIGVLTIGGVMAYFTDYDEVTNEFTYGKVDLELTEPKWDEDEDDNKHDQILPNETFDKDPTIKNVGINDMFVFVEVVVPYKNIITANYDGTRNEAADTELFSYDLNAGWYEITGEAGGKSYPVWSAEAGTVTHLYVYGTKDACSDVAKDSSVSPFSTVTAANAIEGQGLEGKAVDILVKAFAIQADNLAETQNESDPVKVWNIITNQARALTK